MANVVWHQGKNNLFGASESIFSYFHEESLMNRFFW